MMITVENVTSDNYDEGFTINTLDTISGGSGPSGLLATGGARLYPLPYPFAHVGDLEDGDDVELPVNMRDFRKQNHAETFEPGEELNQMVARGLITVAIAADTTDSDIEALSVIAIVD